jgi:hypothetical protein
VILVEGISDRIALETLAPRLGLDGVDIRPIGGAQAIRVVLRALAADARVLGLCDEREAPLWQRAFAEAGRPPAFEVCRADLEEELIRAHGPDGMLAVLEANDDLAPFRTFEKQPAWRGRPIERQLYRYLRSSSSRNLRYARILVESLPVARMPRPLVTVLETATAA